jgi:PAS domain S-box-containing protein
MGMMKGRTVLIKEKRRTKQIFAKKAANHSDICRAIFDNANDIIIFVNRNGTVVEVNERVKDMLGYAVDEIKGRHLMDLPVFFSEDIAFLSRDFKEAAKKEKLLVKKGMNVHVLELRLRHKNGSAVFVEASTRILKAPIKGCCFIGIVRNISRRKEAEQALREAHSRFQKFMDSATEGFVLTDANMNVLDVNAYVLEEFSLKREKVIGANILDYSAGAYESGTYEKFMEVIQTGKEYTYETPTPPSLGNRYLAIKVFRVGNGLGMTVRDISERKRKELALMDSEERFRTLYNSFHAGLMVVDCDGEVTHINNPACGILDVNSNEILGEKAISFFSNAFDDRRRPVAPENNPLINFADTSIRNRVIGFRLGAPQKMVWLLVNVDPIIDQLSRKIDELIVTFVQLTGPRGTPTHKER